MKLTNIRRGMLAMMLLSAAASVVHASSITFEVQLFSGGQESTRDPGNPFADPDPIPPPFPATVSLQMFNTSWGTLQSVELYWIYEADPLIVVQNTDFQKAKAGPPPVDPTYPFTNATASIPLTLMGPVGPNVDLFVNYGPINSAGETPYAAYNAQTGSTTTTAGMNVPPAKIFNGAGCSPDLSIFCVINGYAQYKGATVNGTVTSGAMTDGGILAGYSFAGIHFFDAIISANEKTGSYHGNAVSALLFGGGALAGGRVGVIYTYLDTPVPEPMTMMMVGGAVMGLGVLMRKRNRTKA